VARYKLLHWLSHPQPPTSIDIVRWLMVFDNAANPDALRDYLPSNGPGSILIISRRPGFRISHLRSSYFDLDPFTPDESVDFMRGATRRLQAETSQVETEALRSIADRLGGLPLALAHISSFILSRDLTFAEFLNRYNTSNGRTSILNEGPRIGIKTIILWDGLLSARLWFLMSFTYTRLGDQQEISDSQRSMTSKTASA
jgi:hypothetical protein